jgi:NADH:ubiquinone oxidoreductase subunit F (NADH-binding)
MTSTAIDFPSVHRPSSATAASGHLPRLFAPMSGPAHHHASHLARFGPLPDGYHRLGHGLIEEVRRAGLLGRGGAAFPVATKLDAVAGRRNGVVVVNATDGEPASRKDAVLARVAPHLVIDGAVLAAGAIGALDVFVCVDRLDGDTLRSLQAAAADRPSFEPPTRVLAAPARYVVGEATALARWVGGGEARPVFGVRPDQRGSWGRPTLVHNAETLAHLALIARHGADWFRAMGTAAEPGSTLVTFVGDIGRPGVMEVAMGSDLRSLVDEATPTARPTALLLGGYGGTWVHATTAAELRWCDHSLRTAGASAGAGVVAVLGTHRCGLAETAGLARWFAGESAGQCGPCRFGLPAIADVLETLAAGRAQPGDVAQLHRWLADVDRRGACAHPDLAVRLVRSALTTFGEDIASHLQGRPCAGAGLPPMLPVPDLGGEPWR